MFKIDLMVEIMKKIELWLKEKVIGLMKDELGGKAKTKLAGLRTKTYSYLIDDGREDKKAKNKNLWHKNETQI